GSEGADNHREYKFYGHFADRKGYEPASDEFCQVFVLERWEPLGSAAAPAANASATSAPASAPTDEPPPAPPE
ncbi:MAG: hypothetical protein JO317_04205, partial [Verrucomicrobiae bacterium]|nr:hypothetical protein [Verrucomicrobiae bacterium]